MNISFERKRALVTGASRGIGRGIVEKLVACGAQVIAIAQNVERLNSLKEEFPSVQILSVDLSDWNKTKEVLKTIGDVDLLVNNAGIAIPNFLTDIKEEEINRDYLIMQQLKLLRLVVAAFNIHTPIMLFRVLDATVRRAHLCLGNNCDLLEQLL